MQSTSFGTRGPRRGVPVVVLSPCPDLITLATTTEGPVPRATSAAAGRPSRYTTEEMTTREPVSTASVWLRRQRADRSLLVLNRKGRARLLRAVRAANSPAVSGAAAGLVQHDDLLHCAGCWSRPSLLCASCGTTRLKTLRVGVTRAREELEALLQRTVGEVTGDSDDVPDASVLIGTEAVLHRAAASDLVAFLDLDQELLAPRYRAAEEALALLARAGRIVGGRSGSRGRVVVQTRMPTHPVIDAAVHGDPARSSKGKRPHDTARVPAGPGHCRRVRCRRCGVRRTSRRRPSWRASI